MISGSALQPGAEIVTVHEEPGIYSAMVTKPIPTDPEPTAVTGSNGATGDAMIFMGQVSPWAKAI
jgi:hypothetical protein